MIEKAKLKKTLLIGMGVVLLVIIALFIVRQYVVLIPTPPDIPVLEAEPIPLIQELDIPAVPDFAITEIMFCNDITSQGSCTENDEAVFREPNPVFVNIELSGLTHIKTEQGFVLGALEYFTVYGPDEKVIPELTGNTINTADLIGGVVNETTLSHRLDIPAAYGAGTYQIDVLIIDRLTQKFLQDSVTFEII